MFSSSFTPLENPPSFKIKQQEDDSVVHLTPCSLFIFHCTLISAQGPAAAPAPAGPSDITTILKKDGRFTLFIHLLQSTKVADNINSQLSDDSNAGLTLFAPTDSAFSGLKTGTLNSYTEEKVELVQFHVLPYYLSPSQFQTASNPLTTQAGSSSQLFAMNVTAIGNQVNITTGETNATLVNTIHTDNQLAVYEVDKVLLPQRFYVPMPPPPTKKIAPKAKPASAEAVNSSTAKCLSKVVLQAIVCFVLAFAIFP
ncbi:hypothetical protein ACS0TY_016149 [Phlomoides rotata]